MERKAKTHLQKTEAPARLEAELQKEKG